MSQQAGIVAVLDILGYKSFLENAPIDEAARLISDILTRVPGEVPDILCDAARSFPRVSRDAVLLHDVTLGRIRKLVFADTVLLALPLTPTRDPAFFLSEIAPFLATVSLLLRRFFDQGLPLRGAVVLGEFVIDGYCFAGKALLHALTLGQSLELAGCALEDVTERTIAGALINHVPEPYRRPLAQQYTRLLCCANVPSKSGTEEMRMVRWANPFDQWGGFPPDPVQYVEQSFTAHRKSVDDRARLKLQNTIEFLLSSRLPGADLDIPDGE